MQKERIYELKIEDEDDISGIDRISLVDEGAIGVNWVAFKKETMEDDGPCWKGYEQIGTKMLNGKEVPNCVPVKKEEMADIISDYPESIKNTAKRVLKWVDENGWGSCGTEVGKTRANQLAKGQAISLDTVKRMYSYLSRHEVDLVKSRDYKDGCGRLMYDAWGGKSALTWTESKLKDFGYDVAGISGYKDPGVTGKTDLHFSKEEVKEHIFQVDKEKRMVLGPAMIPDQKIFRKDKDGNPYYVFFTSDTIKMIAEKYMRNKYTDNNDANHNGQTLEDVYVVESWIKEDEQDKSVKYGFGDLPVGTWFVSMKVNNSEVWNKVKSNELNGFSVSGYFEEVAQFAKEEMFLKELVQLLKQL